MNTAARVLPRVRAADRKPPAKPFPWVPAFIVFQLLCQLALIVGDIGWARVIVRIADRGIPPPGPPSRR